MDRYLCSIRAAMCAAMVLWGCSAQTTAAQTAYPTDKVAVIVPFTAGGSTDVVCREVANFLSDHFKVTFFVDNRPGAGGAVGNNVVAQAPADGQTLLCSSSSMTTEQAYRKGDGFDIRKEFVPVYALVDGLYGIFVGPRFPPKTLSELVDYAKANPGKVSYSTSGVGGAQHLATEKFAMVAGLELNHIPYKGNADAVRAAVNNEVNMIIVGLSAAQASIGPEGLRLLAVTDDKRTSVFPETPTTAEAGVAGYTDRSWLGVFARSGTDQKIVDKLADAIHQYLSDPAVQAKYVARGLTVPLISQAAFKERVDSEVETWMKVISSAGIVQQ